jgi:hypothetical protein
MDPETTAPELDAPEASPGRRAPSDPPVPPRRLPWPWTVLLLLLLPAMVAGVWLGGALHQVDDRPVPSPRKPTPGYAPKAVTPMVPRSISPSPPSPAPTPVAPR